MTPNTAGVVIGVAIIGVGLVLAIFSRRVLVQIRRDFRSVFRTDPYASASHWLVRLVGVLATLLGAGMIFFGATGQFG